MTSRLGVVGAVVFLALAPGNAHAGTITEYGAGANSASPPVATAPVGITAGPAGHVWAAGFNNGTIAELSTLGTVLGNHPVPSATAEPDYITVGPDGNLWFTEYNANKLAVMDASTFAVTEHAIPTAAINGLSYVVTGPDGRLWFPDATANEVFAYDPVANSFQTYTGFSASAQLIGITTGPDGNMWVTEQGSATIPARLARISLATGTVTEFATGLSPRAAPLAIVNGPDGALWFTEVGGNGTAPGIGRFDPISQAFTEYRLLPSGATPRGLAVGADGALWFTENGPMGIGRITTSGAVTEYSQGITGSGLFDITPGPSGDPNSLWFTENSNSASTGGLIGRIALDPPVVTTGPAGSVGSSSAVVSGTVDPRGLASTYRFDYGPTTAYGSSAPVPPGNAGAGNAAMAVSATVSGLNPGSTYHYRLVATNAQGSQAGADAVFATSPVAAGAPSSPAPAGSASPPGPGTQPAAATAAPASGTVLIKVPGSPVFMPLSVATPIVPGTIIDVTRGRVTLCRQAVMGARQCADFYGGVFLVEGQSRGGTFALGLMGGDFRRLCAAHARGHARAAARGARSHRVVRSLWGSGHGTFSTHGRYAVASVRGTIWLTQDRCDGTRVVVRRGIVGVADLVHHLAVSVSAGHAYLARAP